MTEKKTTAKANKERGGKFEAFLKDSVKLQDLTYTRLRDVPHLTQRIMTLERELRSAGRYVAPGPMSVSPNPCDCIVKDRGISCYYELKSTTGELKWSDIKQYRRPGDKVVEGQKLNDFWRLHNLVLSGVLVEFCSASEYWFIPLVRLEDMRQERKTGFDHERASRFGFKVEMIKYKGKPKPRLDLKKLHNKLYKKYIKGNS